MSNMRPSAAFEMFNVLASDWPSDPRQIIRISNLLSLMNYVPVLFRSDNESEVAAGSSIASSLLSSYCVTKRWRKAVELLDFLGNLDDEFPSEEVKFFATTNKSRLSQRSVIPPQWRTRVLRALEGKFFERHISQSAKGILDKLERDFPDYDYKEEPGTWKQRGETNIAFDMADEFSKAIIKNAEDCSRLAIELNLLSWVPKLLCSRYQKDSLAGCLWLTSLLLAHAHVREWEQLAGVLETIGELEGTIGQDYVFIAATSLKACYSHPHSLQYIPIKYHKRIREALELPFFQNHFDADHFEIEVLARDRHMAAESLGNGSTEQK